MRKIKLIEKKGGIKWLDVDGVKYGVRGNDILDKNGQPYSSEWSTINFGLADNIKGVAAKI